MSALSLLSDITAQIADGSQPIKVICKIKHNIAEKNLPLTRNETQGNKIARSILYLFYSLDKMSDFLASYSACEISSLSNSDFSF